MADGEKSAGKAGKAGAKGGAACKNPPKDPPAGAGEPAAPARAEEPAPPAGAGEPAAPAKAEEPAPPAGAEGADAPAKAEEPAPPAKAGEPSPPAGAEGADAPAGAEGQDGAPEPRSYTPEEIEEISRRAESYRDSTPPYEPTRVLSPEYGGTSNYERGIDEFRGQKRAELERLRADPGASGAEVAAAEEGLRTLDHLYENYHLGMNVFRTAKGGRSKLRD